MDKLLIATLCDQLLLINLDVIDGKGLMSAERKAVNYVVLSNRCEGLL